MAPGGIRPCEGSSKQDIWVSKSHQRITCRGLDYLYNILLWWNLGIHVYVSKWLGYLQIGSGKLILKSVALCKYIDIQSNILISNSPQKN